MKNTTKIFVQFITATLGSIVIGLIGLALGAVIGGNFGFPAFGENVGYESGGVFFAILGISFGSLLGIRIANKFLHQKSRYVIALLAAAITSVINLLLFNSNMSTIVSIIILLLPAFVLTTVMRWQKPSESIKKQSL
jgi:hypothetical protein